ARRQVRLFQRQFDNPALHFVRDAVPDVIWLGRLILQPSVAALPIPIIPTVERRAGQPQFGKGLTR
ncbi:MAG: hypothetical protein N2B03_06105, partial [Boseongicola sp.]